ATTIRETIAALPDARRAAALQAALAQGTIQTTDAGAIARDLRFPGWETFDATSVGTTAFATTDRNTVTTGVPLGATSPVFLGAAIDAPGKADAINRLLGDDDNAKKIIDLIQSCSPAMLNGVLARIDCDKLFAT